MGERALGNFGWLGTGKTLAQGLLYGCSAFHCFEVGDDRFDEFVCARVMLRGCKCRTTSPKVSMSVPHKPLGSAAVTAMLASIPLSNTLVHSTGVKFCLFAMSACYFHE